MATELYQVAEDRQLQVDRLQASIRKDAKSNSGRLQVARSTRDLQLLPGNNSCVIRPNVRSLVAMGTDSLAQHSSNKDGFSSVPPREGNEIHRLRQEVRSVESNCC